MRKRKGKGKRKGKRKRNRQVLYTLPIILRLVPLRKRGVIFVPALRDVICAAISHLALLISHATLHITHIVFAIRQPRRSSTLILYLLSHSSSSYLISHKIF